MHRRAFTLPEVLIAVSIFTVVVSIAANLYVQSFRETRRANTQNQIYEDARFILQRIADEVKSGMIDYDEYYNQNVVLPLINASEPAGGPALGVDNFGQNFGRYYSAFFHTGSDNALGFGCNDGLSRNQRDATCTPLRRTIDKNTGANPYPGKNVPLGTPWENAFCGEAEYSSTANDGDRNGICDTEQDTVSVPQLYLISADSSQKTIIAREQIGSVAGVGGVLTPLYALSMLRLRGVDTDRDGVFDSFVCAEGFSCRANGSGSDVVNVDDDPEKVVPPLAPCGGGSTGELPRRDADGVYTDLQYPDGTCEPDLDSDGLADDGFSKDFIPISPLRANVSQLSFSITPSEYPHYAFAEDSAQIQPRVTITLTVAPNQNATGVQDKFEPITLVETVSTRIRTPIAAPKLIF